MAKCEELGENRPPVGYVRGEDTYGVTVAICRAVRRGEESIDAGRLRGGQNEI